MQNRTIRVICTFGVLHTNLFWILFPLILLMFGLRIINRQTFSKNFRMSISNKRFKIYIDFENMEQFMKFPMSEYISGKKHQADARQNRKLWFVE